MYGSYQRFLAESARLQVEARKAKPVVRDQSEDRKQSDNIVFGKETPDGVRYGVKGRDGENVVDPSYSAEVATAWAVGADSEDGTTAAANFCRSYERAYPAA